MSGWLTALRIARREARRAKGRSVLVIALIGLPVFALTFAAVSYDSFRLTAAQAAAREIGAADAVVSWPFDGPVVQLPDGTVQRSGAEPRGAPVTEAELQKVLVSGARGVPRLVGRLELRTATGRDEFHTERLDLTDPIHQDRVVLRDGRAPTGDDEAALTRWAADRLGVAIGDEVVTAEGDRRWTVVGIAEYPYRFRTAVLLPPPGGTPAAEDWLVGTPTPVTWDNVQELNRYGIVVRSRAVLLDPPPSADRAPVLAVGGLVAGLALLEVVLLAGPAFAVGARRRQRDLALVAASGGSPAHQRRIVLADGVVLGLAGAAAGITLGVAVAIGTLPLLEEHLLGRRAGGIRLFPLALAGTAGLAVLTGLLAALLPAVVAARQHVVTALSGRRGALRSRRRWLLAGLAATALGAGLAGAGAWRVETGLVLTGLVLVQLGLVLCTPALVGLVSRAGRLLPLAPRIALRDTARNRAVAAPAISAVMAAVAGALALGVYLSADQERSRDGYQAGLPAGNAAVPYQVWNEDGLELLSAAQREDVRAALWRTLPTEQVLEVRAPVCPPQPGADRCRVRVPVPEERRCPAEAMLRERGGHLSAEEQRAARADPRCQEVRRGWSVYLGDAVVDDGTALPALVGGTGEHLAAATAVLREGGVVVTDPARVVDGHATVVVTYDNEQEAATHRLTVPAYALTSGETVPFAVLSPGALARTGLTADPYALVAATSAVPTQAQEDALREELHTVRPGLQGQAMVEPGEHPFGDGDPFLLAFAGSAGVVALGAAGIATGLAAADRRGDLSTLGAVGAAPGVRRLLSLSQSGVIAGLGALLGMVAGLGSAFAVMVVQNRSEAHMWPVDAPPYQLTVPWPAIGLLVLVVPAVAMLGTGLFSRSRLPIERRL